MGKPDGLVKFLSAAGNQLVHSDNLWKYEPDKREIHISNNCRARMKQLGLTQARVLDTYYHGFMYEPKKLVKEYPGEKVGVWYMLTSDNAKVVITHVWTREIR